MQKFREYITRIYGMDALSCGLVLLSLLMLLITTFLVMKGVSSARIWNIAGFLPLVWCFFRFFSVNHERRSAENHWFIRLLTPLLGKKEKEQKEQEMEPEKEEEEGPDQARFEQVREDKKTFKYFKCPACRQKIRVPKGKGKIEITCPRCGDRFIKKT